MLPLWKICFKNIPLISFVSRKRPVASKIQSQWNIHRSQKFSSQLLEGKLATPLLAARKIANAPTSSTPVGAPKHPRVQPQPLPVAEVAIQRKVNLRNRRNLNSLWCSNITLHQGLCKKKPIIFNFPFNFLAYLILIALGEKSWFWISWVSDITSWVSDITSCRLCGRCRSRYSCGRLNRAPMNWKGIDCMGQNGQNIILFEFTRPLQSLPHFRERTR